MTWTLQQIANPSQQHHRQLHSLKTASPYTNRTDIMYLPYWVSATLALFNGASRTADPIGTHHNIFAKNGDQKYYLSVDKVEKGAVPHL